MEELLIKAYKAITRARPCAFATVVQARGSTPRKAGSKMIVYGDGTTCGTIGGGAVEHDVVHECLRALRKKQPIFKTYRLDSKEGRPICGGSMSVFIEPLQRSSSIIIVGGGHIGLPLSFIAKLLGFHVTVIDDRREFAQKQRFPHIDNVIRGVCPKKLKQIPTSYNTYIVIMTYGHEHDYEVLNVALKKDVRYIGLVASAAKIAQFRTRLKTNGFSQKDIKRIHSPVGLDIGAQTPEEIAVSIIAQIVSVENA